MGISHPVRACAKSYAFVVNSQAVFPVGTPRRCPLHAMRIAAASWAWSSRCSGRAFCDKNLAEWVVVA
jgi:hypothetical protein